MRRRGFISLAGAVAAWPQAAVGQQDGRERRVGVLLPFAESDQEAQARLQVFRRTLADLGWTEGRNFRIDVRWAGSDIARQRSRAHELVVLMPQVILTATASTTRAMREATQIVPIVFVQLVDPVAVGVVSNLARPDTNVTGFMIYEPSLAGKWFSLLKDMVPSLRRVTLLYGGDVNTWMPIANEAGERLSLLVTAAGALNLTELESVIAALAGGDGGLVLLPNVFTFNNRAAIFALTAKYRVPAIYVGRTYAAEGGLMSYGADQKLQYRDGATYVDRILRGAKPVNLPVQFATKFELVINLKTAKALGLDVRPDLLTLADEIIE
jgi:putative tryptophan/tyrosine transport system substrate-binding protein